MNQLDPIDSIECDRVGETAARGGHDRPPHLHKNRAEAVGNGGNGVE